MYLSYLILLLNVSISIFHPIKYIPQIIHTIKRKSADDLSFTNIICEIILNFLSVISFFLLMYFYVGKNTIFIPIISEKLSSTIFITTIFYLKKNIQIHNKLHIMKLNH